MNSIQNIFYIALLLFRVGFCKSIDENVSLQDKIVGGVPITSFERPYQVSIQHIVEGHNCGGSLISRWHILTAGHCTGDDMIKSPEKWRIMAGYESLNTSSPHKQYRSVVSAIRHENYTFGPYPNDIAIIKVNKPFDISKTVQIVTLRLKPTKTGEPCTISGWGRISFQGPMSDNLLILDAPIYDHYTCNGIYEYNNPITDTMICAGKFQNGTGVCFGDSGGPLMCDNELTGIASFIYSEICGGTNVPAVYTEVYHFKKWIDEHTL